MVPLPSPYDRLASLIEDGADAQTSRALRGLALQRMLHHAKTASPFWAERIPDALLEGRASPAVWAALPLLSKADLRAHDGAITVANPPAFAGASRSVWTSGSTGEPLNGHVSALADHMNALVLQRFYRWWNIDPAKALIHITVDHAGYQDKPAVETKQGWYPGEPRGTYHHVTLNTGLDAQLDIVATVKPAYLKTFPAQLGAMAARAKERNLRIKFDTVFSGGSPLSDEERAFTSDTFNCRVADIYGAEEIGIIAADCPRCGTHHVAVEHVLLEVLRDDNTPAPAGELGRAVVTPFANFAMPLVRYELGDVVELPKDPFACPNGTQSLRRIIGRRKNMFTLPDGQRFLPYVSLGDIAKLGPVARFRFVQTDVRHVEFRYALRGPGDIDVARLKDIVRKYLSAQLTVTPVPMLEADMDPTRKFLVFESLV